MKHVKLIYSRLSILSFIFYLILLYVMAFLDTGEFTSYLLFASVAFFMLGFGIRMFVLKCPYCGSPLGRPHWYPTTSTCIYCRNSFEWK